METETVDLTPYRRQLWKGLAKIVATITVYFAGSNDATANLVYVILSNLVTALSVGDVATIEHMAAVIHADVGLTIDIIESGGGEDES